MARGHRISQVPEVPLVVSASALSSASKVKVTIKKVLYTFLVYSFQFLNFFARAYTLPPLLPRSFFLYPTCLFALYYLGCHLNAEGHWCL